MKKNDKFVIISVKDKCRWKNENKKFFSGLVTGAILTSLLLFAFAKADEFGLEFNQFRINVNGMDDFQWGDNARSASGEWIPSSLCYKDTTYVPLRVMSNILGSYVHYKDDSKTIYVLKNELPTNNGSILAEKPDKNGDVWTYSVYTDKNGWCYLVVRDQGNYKNFKARYYRIPGKEYVRVTDDAIYFLKITSIESVSVEYNIASRVGLWKIDFLNDVNSQDGVSIGSATYTNDNNLNWIFDENYIIGMYRVYSSVSHSEMYVHDFINNKTSSCYLKQWCKNLTVENNGDTLLLKYEIDKVPLEDSNESLVFDKASMTFSGNRNIKYPRIYDYNEKKYVDIEVKND